MTSHAALPDDERRLAAFGLTHKGRVSLPKGRTHGPVIQSDAIQVLARQVGFNVRYPTDDTRSILLVVLAVGVLRLIVLFAEPLSLCQLHGYGPGNR